MPWARTNPVIQHDVRGVCACAYPNHKKGCPNFGKRPSCPPNAPLIELILDLDKPLWVVWNAFDFDAHTTKMREAHPEWSQRQIECCLYWQGTARKQLRQEARRFRQEWGNHWLILSVPEAHGVNVTETMRREGIELEWPPVTVAYQVALAGCPHPQLSEEWHERISSI